jgi:hypothetical protein
MGKGPERSIRDYNKAMPLEDQKQLALDAHLKINNIRKFISGIELAQKKSGAEVVVANFGSKLRPLNIQVSPSIVEKWRKVIVSETIYITTPRQK